MIYCYKPSLMMVTPSESGPTLEPVEEDGAGVAGAGVGAGAGAEPPVFPPNWLASAEEKYFLL